MMFHLQCALWHMVLTFPVKRNLLLGGLSNKHQQEDSTLDVCISDSQDADPGLLCVFWNLYT